MTTGPVARFLGLSAALTGFDETELHGTGMVGAHYDELVRTLGSREVGKLLGAWDAAVQEAAGDACGEDAVRRLLDDDRYGPVARNLITLWYLGTWSQLPRQWRNAYGAMSLDYDRVASPAAYREGLVWPAAGTHPMGAKQPGFGSWTEPPLRRPASGPREAAAEDRR